MKKNTKKDNKKKKTIGIIAIIVVVIALIVVSSAISPKEDNNSVQSEDAETIFANAQKESQEITEEERKAYIPTTVSSYVEMYKDEEYHLFLLGRDTCNYCQIAEPILQKMAKDYNIDIYYLNTEEMSEADQIAFFESDSSFEDEIGTPLLFITKNGSVQDRVEGVVDYAHYAQFLVRNGIVE